MTTNDNRSFLEIQQEHALEKLRKRAAETRRIAELVIGTRPRPGHRVNEVVKLGGDYLVEVVQGDRTTWTTVVNGEAGSWNHHSQEEAILHLIARRYNDNSSIRAAFYAGRVLGLPQE